MTYETKYDADHVLVQKLDRDEFEYLVGNLNQTLQAHWPCSFLIYVGYLLALFTFGLSFALPNFVIKDAKRILVTSIEHQNKKKLNKIGLELKFVQKCSTSWLEINEKIIASDNEIVK